MDEKITKLLGASVSEDRVEYHLGPITSLGNLSIVFVLLGCLGAFIYGILYILNEPEWPIPGWPIIAFILVASASWVAMKRSVKRGDLLGITIFKKVEKTPEFVYEIHYANKMFASGEFSPEQLRIDTVLDVTSRFGPTVARVYRLLFCPRHPSMEKDSRLQGRDFVLYEDENPKLTWEQLELLLKTLGVDLDDVAVQMSNRPS